MMKHYEIVLMISPNRDKLISGIIENYKNFVINNSAGKIHRIEEWGCRKLSYPIMKFDKAYYILINIEIKKNIIQKIINKLNLDESIIRFIVLRVRKAFKEDSLFIKNSDETK